MPDDGTVPLVGRDPESRHLRAAMERVRAGHSAVTVLEGEPGIGKSRLVREIELLARAEHWHVAEFRCAELDADRPFEAVACGLEELCSGLADAVPFELGEVVYALRHGRTESSVPGDQVTTLVLEGLRELSRTAPCLVIFDDAHWIDEASAQVLWGLTRRHQKSPLLVLATFRPSTESRVVALRRGLDALGAPTLTLNPLSGDAGEAIVASMLGAAPDAGARRLLDDAGGNPLFIIELLRGQHEVGAPSDGRDGRVPASLRGLVERRLTALPPASLSALGDAALLGLRFDLDDLALTLDVRPVELLGLLAPALESRVLVADGALLMFRHGVVQSIVAGAQPEFFRLRRHREIAERLASGGRASTRVAEHYWLSRPAPESEVAECMARAAFEVRSLSLESALTWLERARTLSVGPGRFSVTMDIACVLVLLNRTTEAEAQCRSPQIRPDSDDDQVRLNEVLAAIASMSGPSRAEEAAGYLAAIEACFETHDPRRIEPLGWRAVLSVLQGQLEQGREIAGQALAIPVNQDSEPFRSQALEALSLISILEADMSTAQRFGAEAVSIHRERSDRFSTLMMTTPHFTYALSLLPTEPIGSIMGVLHDGFQVCDRAGHLLARLHLEPLLATSYFVRGDIVHAEAVVSRTLERNVYARTGVALPTATALSAFISMLRGDLDGATALAETALAELLGGGAQAGTAEFAVWCIAGVAEEAGQVDRARDLLVGVWELVAKEAGLYSITPDLVRLTRESRPDFAADVVERCAARAGRSSTPLDRAHAHATKGWFSADCQELCRAADAWAELDWFFSGNRMLHLGLGLAPKEARAAMFTRIRRDWERMELSRMVTSLDSTFGDLARRSTRTRRPATGPESLSQAEIAVVRLVGEGLTNKEIAERLFVSHRTVDTHVSHSFAKLGVNGRVALAGIVARGEV